MDSNVVTCSGSTDCTVRDQEIILTTDLEGPVSPSFGG